MNIFTYWEGPQPPYIAACLNSLKRLYPDAVILDKGSALELVGDMLHSNFKNIDVPAHRADCIRTALIYKLGGWWVDADTLFLNGRLQNPESSYSSQLYYSRWNDGRVLTGYFYGVKDSPVMKDWLFAINKQLATGATNGWTGYGEKLLTPIVYGKHKDNCCNISRTIFLPVNIDKIPFVLFEPVDYAAFTKGDTVALGLNHSWFCDLGRWLLTATVKEIAESNTLIGSAFRGAGIDGGYICGHDYGGPETEGVTRAVQELFGTPDNLYIDWSWSVKKVEGRIHVNTN